MRNVLHNKVIFILLLPFTIVLSYIASFLPNLIENIYSNGIFKILGQILSSFTGIVPFSVAEFIILSITFFSIISLILMTKKMINNKKGIKNIFIKAAKNVLILFSFIYFFFMLLWGLNYQRLPFSKIANLDTQPATINELAELCENIIERTNDLRTRVTENEEGVMNIPKGYLDLFDRASKGYENISITYPELSGIYGRPKGVLLSNIMSYTGIAGVYFPFTAEANVNIAIPDSMLPSTTAHEMAHQRGFAREDEANYIAYLTCTIHPDTDFQYSGILLALIHSMNTLYVYDYDKYNQLKEKYNDGILRDLKAMRAYWQRYEGPIEKISTEINDAYLKANKQKQGVQSYGRMVDLLIAEYRLKKSNYNLNE